MSLNQLATEAEVDRGNLSRLENGKAGMRDAGLSRVAAVFGRTIGDLYQFAESEAAPTPLLPAPSAIEASKDLICVPLMEAAGSMGPGIMAPEHDPIIGTTPLSLPYLRRQFQFTRPDALRIVIGYGDSMMGTFADGDPLLIDVGITELKLDAIYVLARPDPHTGDEELLIKRVQRSPHGGYEIISDNPKYKSYMIESPAELGWRVIARVLGAWNLNKF